MKITAVRLIALTGEMAFSGTFWEERLVRPLDLYPQHRDDPPAWLELLGSDRYRMRSTFVHIDTDHGVYGIGGPISEDQAFAIARQIRPLLIGQDPLAIELHWDRIYRSMVHGRKGTEMMALSAVDCALWDLKGRFLDQPVYRLLGGPTRDSVPAYASCLGYSVDPERAASGPFGATIAHGFLTLSMLPLFIQDALRFDDVRMSVNYGLNRVRFTSPVPVGSALRARFRLVSVEDVAGNGMQVTMEVTIERQGADKPVCVAETISRRYV